MIGIHGGAAGLMVESTKVLAGKEPADSMSLLLVTGSGEKATIRFEGGKRFLDVALQAVKRLVVDIMAAAED